MFNKWRVLSFLGRAWTARECAMLKTKRDQLAVQLAAIDNMLQSLPPNDYLGRVGFETRRAALQGELDAIARGTRPV